MRKEVTVDMTTGSIGPQILRFAMPVLLGLIFQRIYNFADSYIVGRFLGDNALAAVSVAGVGMYLMQSLVIGLTTGVTVVMSQYYGAKNEKAVEETFFSSIYVVLYMTLLVTVVGLIGTLNIFLDWLLVAVLPMGVGGAATSNGSGTAHLRSGMSGLCVAASAAASSSKGSNEAEPGDR